MKPPDELPEFVSAKQAVRETNIPLSTLRTAHFGGELPALKLGKEGSRRLAWYFKRADLVAWLERHTEGKPLKQAQPRLVAHPVSPRGQKEAAR